MRSKLESLLADPEFCALSSHSQVSDFSSTAFTMLDATSTNRNARTYEDMDKYENMITMTTK